jgi:hypothetical protein
MLATIPLTDDELAAVEDGHTAVEALPVEIISHRVWL